jgi:hypothetical protein
VDKLAFERREEDLGDSVVPAAALAAHAHAKRVEFVAVRVVRVLAAAVRVLEQPFRRISSRGRHVTGVLRQACRERRVEWRSVGTVVERVLADERKRGDAFANLALALMRVRTNSGIATQPSSSTTRRAASFGQASVVTARAELETWISWAARSRLEPFVKLANSVRAHRERIEAAFDICASNGLAESTNTRIRLLHRFAFGFHSAAPFIALAVLKLGGLCPPLPRERYPRLRQ